MVFEPLVNCKDMLNDALRGGYAVGAFSMCNAETAQATIREAERQQSPVMFIIGPCELTLLGSEMITHIVKFLAARTPLPVCLHLDHATEIELVEECIEAGFPSVMIDASQHPFEENIRITRAVVELARPRGITVEGELGAVGRVGDATPEGAAGSGLTDPVLAAEFVERTGVDALAVSIGNAHGLYTRRPEFDFEILAAIRQAVHIPLVLHGGSGTPVDHLHRAIALGIAKVNVASELGRAYLNTLHEVDVATNGKTWYSNVIECGTEAISQVVGRWMQTLGCAGQIR